MKKLGRVYYPFSLLMLLLPFKMSFSQNVGVGTIAPNARLEIKDTANTKVKITSKNFVDTSQLVLSNRLSDLYGTDMILSSNQEQGIRVIARSDLPGNNSDSILMITPSGRLGINKPGLPAYTLDVNGDINTAGSLRINGNQGTNGQVLRSNGNGSMTWGNIDLSDYPNLATFWSAGSGTWSVPAGITRILVEVWGAGGGANIYGGGGGGGYVKAVISVTPGGTVSYTVGASGPGSTNTGTNGGSSSISYGGTISVTANGGYGAAFTSPAVSSGSGGNFIPLGTIAFVGMNGERGEPIKNEFTQTGASVFYETVTGGRGGNAGNTENSGGEASYAIAKATAPVSNIKYQYGGYGRQPGGGGGSGVSYVTAGLGFVNGSDGAAGMVIIHY